MHEKRFQYPDFINSKHPGFGFLDIHCRLDEKLEEADLWFNISHIPVDGMQMQELLQDLKQQWGTYDKLVFPSLSNNKQVVPQRCSTTNGKNASYCANWFEDFQPLLAVRKKINEQYAADIGGDITILSMLAWGLAHYQRFNDMKFNFPLDLNATPQRERTVGFFSMRPGLYFDKNGSKNGFLEFQRNFNQRLQATKERKSESYELYELCAIGPARMNSLISKLTPKGIAEFFGTSAISSIRDAEFFMATGSADSTGYSLAFGNFEVPTEDGQIAGSVSVKGSLDMVKESKRIVNEVVRDFSKYI